MHSGSAQCGISSDLGDDGGAVCSSSTALGANFAVFGMNWNIVTPQWYSKLR